MKKKIFSSVYSAVCIVWFSGGWVSGLTIFGRVTIAASAMNTTKIGLVFTIRYSLSRRAFSVRPNEPEVLLIDYPSHQRRLLPLLAKRYALSFSSNYLKMIYVKRTPKSVTGEWYNIYVMVSLRLKSLFPNRFRPIYFFPFDI